MLRSKTLLWIAAASLFFVIAKLAIDDLHPDSLRSAGQLVTPFFGTGV